MEPWFYEKHVKGINLRLWYANRMDERISLGQRPRWWREASWPLRCVYNIRGAFNWLVKGYEIQGYYWP